MSENKMTPWLGHRYPTAEDLEAFANGLGAVIEPTRGTVASCTMIEGGAVILIPSRWGPLKRAWAIAHELGHLVRHSGPKTDLSWSKDEAAANHWAACALIPEARIRHHGNASLDALIGALSAHYEDLPMEDCPARRLAARIAGYRLRALERGVA